MARRTRCSDAGYVYHVLNRAVGRAKIFDKSADYAAFEKVLRQAWERTAMRLLAPMGMSCGNNKPPRLWVWSRRCGRQADH